MAIKLKRLGSYWEYIKINTKQEPQKDESLLIALALWQPCWGITIWLITVTDKLDCFTGGFTFIVLWRSLNLFQGPHIQDKPKQKRNQIAVKMSYEPRLSQMTIKSWSVCNRSKKVLPRGGRTPIAEIVLLSEPNPYPEFRHRCKLEKWICV